MKEKTKSLNREFETTSKSVAKDSSKDTRRDEFETKNYQATSNVGWLEITDPLIMDLILKNYGDVFGRRILLSATDAPRTISGILSACDIPQTTGYRRTLQIIEDKLLIPLQTASKVGERKTKQYITTFTDIQIMISCKGVTINAKPNPSANLESQINFQKHL